MRGPLDGTISEARTAAILAATFLGLAVVIELERGVERRKVRTWVWGMVAGFVVLLSVGLYIPWLTTFFEVEIPTASQWGLIVAVVVVGLVAVPRGVCLGVAVVVAYVVALFFCVVKKCWDN